MIYGYGVRWTTVAGVMAGQRLGALGEKHPNEEYGSCCFSPKMSKGKNFSLNTRVFKP